jgi:hypothetical protein
MKSIWSQRDTAGIRTGHRHRTRLPRDPHKQAPSRDQMCCNNSRGVSSPGRRCAEGEGPRVNHVEALMRCPRVRDPRFAIYHISDQNRKQHRHALEVSGKAKTPWPHVDTGQRRNESSGNVQEHRMTHLRDSVCMKEQIVDPRRAGCYAGIAVHRQPPQGFF